MRKPKQKPHGKWVFVPDDPGSAAQQQERAMDEVTEMLMVGASMATDEPFYARSQAAKQFYDYFPGDQQVPECGAWIMVKSPPPTEYTVPPLSFWFAEPWPLDCGHHTLHRVKIVTPRGDLGVLPREYSLIKEPEKFYEFLGQGIDIKFFGGTTSGVPVETVFYAQTRGISKREAMMMLLGQVRSHGVCWLETSREIASHFVDKFPADSKLATA